ncbi:DUF7453 family protein [Algisphaera agarilytica]|uniref:Uncharacterized protein n=1 Tax=Algisphaera agarilytica TaxID=1385975 RepID=A0A7X0LJV5_9BACT|nr:choice-of-anchor tandem repeat NxxGxxAF-containing protein [Algisphaera agarilytica]MBB6429780.1 hypothetical protein [Algisphaera agarilytica]
MVGVATLILGGAVQAAPSIETQVLVTTGQTVPGGFTLDSFQTGVSSTIRSPFWLNDTGQVAFAAALAGTPGGFDDNLAIYRVDATGTGLVEIARTGQTPPDGAGAFTYFGTPPSFAAAANPHIAGFNNVGQVAFIADISTNDDPFAEESGIYVGDGTPGGLVGLGREG